MLKWYKGFGYIAGNWYVHLPFNLVPIESDVNIHGACPVSGDFVVFLKCMEKVFGMGFPYVFDAKVIDN